MTTPGGVPNLPAGALTLETLGSKLQDMTTAAMRSRAAARMPSVFDTSNGGVMDSDLTPFGIITRLWAEFNSAVANADPSDIQGPDDLPGLLLDFIEGLPVVGEFVGLLEAISGTYDGDDDVLLEIQAFFTLIRNAFHGIDLTGDPGAVLDQITAAKQAIWDKLTDIVSATDTDVDDWLLSLFDKTTWQTFLDGLKDKFNGTSGSSGTTLSDLLTAAAAQRSSILSKAQQSDLTALVSGMGLADWAHLITDLVSTRSTAGTASSSAATANTNWQTIVDNITNKFTGQNFTGWGQADSASAMDAQAKAIATLAAAVQALQSQNQSNNNPGKVYLIDFSTRSNSTTSVGSDVTQTYSAGPGGGTAGTGTYGLLDGKAHWYPQNDNPRMCHCLYNAGQLATDTQIVGGAFASAPGNWSSLYADNRFRLRMNAAGTTYVEAEFRNNRVILRCVVSGSATTWFTLGAGGSGSFTFKPGTVYWLVAGTVGGARTFQVLEGSTPIISYTESGTTSQLGASYRYVGWAVACYAGVFGSNNPGDMVAWAAADNALPTVLGSYFRAIRTTTSSPGNWPSGDNTLPNSFFNSVEVITADLAYNSSSANSLTIGLDGNYAVTIQLYAGTASAISQAGGVELYVNTNLERRQVVAMGTGSGAGQLGTPTATWLLPLLAGDVLQPGTYASALLSSAGGALAGDAAGLRCFWEVALVNRSIA